jgi:azurin
LQDPPPIAGAPLTALLGNLKRAEYRYRYWTRRELRERDPGEVAAALDAWVAALDREDPRFRHHQVEAVWAYRTVGATRPALLAELLGCEEHQARAAATHQLRHWHAGLPEGGLPLLAASARDPNGLVRMEAVVAASYIGTRAALDAVVEVMARPMGDHLRHAAVTAFGSEALRRHWEMDPALAARIGAFLKGTPKGGKLKVQRRPRTPAEIAFEKQPGMATVEISTIPERMMFTPTEFTVKPGQPVKLVVLNPDAMQHNLVIVRPGALEEIGMAGNEMAKDPAGIAKHFVPESDQVLHATRLIDPNAGVVLRFNAPEASGAYPFVCTFPGHWVVMNGKMFVK